MMTCLIVDDEPLARELLQDNVSKVPNLKLAGTCSNALEAMEVVNRQHIDLIFLDIQMPGLSGIQFLQSLKKPVMVILITAYEKFALDGYNLNVVDYLLKPLSLERFLKAVNKADELFRLRAVPNRTSPPTSMFVHADYNLVRIVFTDVIAIEGLKDYVKIHLTTSQRPILTRMSMKTLEEQLPASQFRRVHKSYIICMDKIISIRKGRIRVGTMEVPLSSSYSDSFFDSISITGSKPSVQ